MDGPIGLPIYIYAAFRQHILYYLPFLDLQVLLKPELQTYYIMQKEGAGGSRMYDKAVRWGGGVDQCVKNNEKKHKTN